MASEKDTESIQWLKHVRLCSTSPELISAWEHVFTNSRYTGLIQIENIEINQVDLSPNSALIIPGNSFGILSPQNNAIHNKAIELFGSNLQDKLTSIIHEKHNNELLVGKSTHFPLPTPTQHLIYIPTQRVDTCKENKMGIFLSLRAALLRVRKYNKASSKIINTIVSFVSLEDQMPPIRVAVQMKVALDAILFNKCPIFQSPENLPHPLSLDVALSKLKEISELETNRCLINCML